MRSKLVITCILSSLMVWLGTACAENLDGHTQTDLGACSLKVVQTEIIQEVRLTSEKILKTEDKQNQLIAMTIEGTSSESGLVIINPFIFSAYYMIEDHTQLILAKAVGGQEEDDKGQPIQIWTNHPRNAYGFGTPAGKNFRFNLIFEIPKDCKTILLGVPTLLDDPVNVTVNP